MACSEAVWSIPGRGVNIPRLAAGSMEDDDNGCPAKGDIGNDERSVLGLSEKPLAEPTRPTEKCDKPGIRKDISPPTCVLVIIGY